MDVQEVVQIISSVGFPIVACCGMFYLYDTTIKNIINTLNKMDDTLTELSNAIKGGKENGNDK